MEQPVLKRHGMHMQSPLWGVAASVLAGAVLLTLLIHFGAHAQVLHLLRWFDAQRAWAPLFFLLIWRRWWYWQGCCSPPVPVSRSASSRVPSFFAQPSEVGSIDLV